MSIASLSTPSRSYPVMPQNASFTWTKVVSGCSKAKPTTEDSKAARHRSSLYLR